MTTVGIIPARYASSRFPGKPLAKILGKPMILHVAEITAQALRMEHTYIATDDERIFQTAINKGYKAVMTSADCPTGTDRLWEAAQQIDADIYLNIQGDEPMLLPEDILKVRDKRIESGSGVSNGYCALSDTEDPVNVNIPKVLCSESEHLIYMSRLPIPGTKSTHKPKPYFKQVCIYAYGYSELEAYGKFGRKCEMEVYEDIEILRFIELGIPVHMVKTEGSSLAVDMPEDIAIVERALSK